MIKPFQKQDLARAALHDGLVLAWDTGLGKTWAAYLWPLLKLGYDWQPSPNSELRSANSAPPQLVPRGSVLIIAPGDLHQQMRDEATRRFRLPVTVLETQRDFLDRVLRTDPGGRPVVAPGFYIASYQAVAINGTRPMPDVDDASGRSLMAMFCLTDTHVEAFFAKRAGWWKRQYATLNVGPQHTREEAEQIFDVEVAITHSWTNQTAAANRVAELENAWEIVSHLLADIPNARFANLAGDDQDWVCREFMRQWIQKCSEGLGELRYLETTAQSAPQSAIRNPQSGWPIRCLYSPSLADLCWNTFDCVVVDEGVRMKGEDTLTGMRVRQMEPRYRLVLTATPVKNRLPDIFRLAWWAAGGKDEAHGRWPYSNESTERDEFAKTFLVSERNITKEAQSENEGKRRRFVKLTAEVCNIHRLWKLLAPVVLRRRKQDVGEQIVPKHRHVIRVQMGTRQATTYAYHLHAKYVDRNKLPAIGAKLQALRVAAAAPNSLLLTAQPQSGGGTPRSSTGYTPKIHAALRLIERFLRAGEQFVVFSAFHDPLDILSGRLRHAGVIHAVLDGRASPAKRGEVAARFKLGAPAHGRGGSIPGLLAGVECMAEGHDFFLANNVILLAYSWAFDKFEQAINRVHRLPSPKPVNVWSILCDGTIDRKLESSIQEKGDSAELVLDGKLMGERAEEFNLAQLLSLAEVEFRHDAKTVDEDSLLTEWPALANDLRDAQITWDNSPPAQSTRPDSPTSPIRSDLPAWRAAFNRAWNRKSTRS